MYVLYLVRIKKQVTERRRTVGTQISKYMLHLIQTHNQPCKSVLAGIYICTCLLSHSRTQPQSFIFLKSYCSLQLQEVSFSRIPIYEGNRNNIVTVLLTKTLIYIDPNQNIPIRTLISSNATRNVITVNPDQPLFEILFELKGPRGI
jgi:hypothetical protein